MSAIKTEYKIEVWQDNWNGTGWDETKVITIGANDMDFLGRVRNPILKMDVNGEVSFSFSIYTRYFNPITGQKEDNYLLPYLFNEAKIKVYCPEYDDGRNGGWFDFIIKDIKENRKTDISYSYTCQYLPINELSRNGQGLTFSLDLENSTDKIDGLLEQVLDGTEWDIGEIDADLTEATEETLFKVITTEELDLVGVPRTTGTPADISGLPIGSILYLPYSQIVNTESDTIQVIYTADDLVFKNGNIIYNKDCNYFVTRTSIDTTTCSATEYRGYNIVLTYQTDYKNVSTDAITSDYRYVTVYSKDGDTTVYYGYTTTEITSEDINAPLVVGEVQHYFYYNESNEIINADDIIGLSPVLIANSEKYRTLEAEQSNRFNLIQSIAELFEVWARFDIYHDEDGRITFKKVSFVDTIGSQKWAGFTYGINLTNITRNVVSSELSTKMFVTELENENLDSGSCSIAYAGMNTAREEFLINLDYYVQVGLLDNETLTYDLYDVNNSTGIGYLTKLGNLNIEYQNYVSSTVSLKTQVKRYTELVAAMEDGIEAAQGIADQILLEYNGGVSSKDRIANYNINYQVYLDLVASNTATRDAYQTKLDNYNTQLEAAETRQAEIKTEKIALDTEFNTKYSRYLQEGSWEGETTYVNDDLYYYDAQNVLLESSRPSIEYTMSTIDISVLTGYEDYKYNIGDVTYVEDVEYFGYTTPDARGYSIPYREQVIVSSIECNLDSPESNKITIQNYKNQFDSLFQRMSATIQSYQFNEQVYQRANNFTNDGEITFDSLQASLINNGLIGNLAKELAEDIIIDRTGITLKDLIDSNKIVRIVSGGIFLSKDGGTNWNSGVTGEGINTSLLTAGQIDVGHINIVSGSYPTFSWDSTGLYAYSYTGTPDSLVMDATSFVRFDQDGIAGEKDGTTIFSLDWDGLYLKTGSGAYDIQLGSHTISSVEYLFSAINNTTDTRTFSIDANGNAYFAGELKAATGTFSGSLNAASGTFSGSLSAASGTFTGDISGASGTFTGDLSGSTITGSIINAPTITGDYLSAYSKFIIKKVGGPSDTSDPIIGYMGRAIGSSGTYDSATDTMIYTETSGIGITSGANEIENDSTAPYILVTESGARMNCENNSIYVTENGAFYSIDGVHYPMSGGSGYAVFS